MPDKFDITKHDLGASMALGLPVRYEDIVSKKIVNENEIKITIKCVINKSDWRCYIGSLDA